MNDQRKYSVLQAYISPLGKIEEEQIRKSKNQVDSESNLSMSDKYHYEEGYLVPGNRKIEAQRLSE
jgi:hypothetical protein